MSASSVIDINKCLDRTPIVAILAGLPSSRAAEVGIALLDAGVTVMEVPLRGANVADALESVRLLAAAVGDRALVGAGTVLRPEQVDEVAAAGAKLIVSPNFDRAVVERTLMMGLISLPGVFTPTEAHAALNAGAHALKWFPTDGMSPKSFKAICQVLPAGTAMLAVGGVDCDNAMEWWSAGARGFGIGSAIFKPALTTEQVRSNAMTVVAAARACRTGKKVSRAREEVMATRVSTDGSTWRFCIAACATTFVALALLSDRFRAGVLR